MNKLVVGILIMGLAVFGITFMVLIGTKDADRMVEEVEQEDAVKILDKLYEKLNVGELPQIKGNVDLDEIDLAESLPEINKYPLQVRRNTEDYVEIFSSTEKATLSNSGQDNDKWLIDMAEKFNKEGNMVDGKPVSVEIRGIASGLAVDYIVSGKYTPDAFTPSNTLWGDNLESMGIPVNLVEERLTGNVSGIVLSNKANEQIIQKYGAINIGNVIEAVANGEIQMGYTNPFVSSTGANFLMSTLCLFDGSNPLSEQAAEAFNKFQNNVPYVAYTTLQMKGSALSGVLDGLVYESQQYNNTPEFKGGYVFTPFGVRHDNPVYEIGNISDTKKEILKLFIDFCKTDENQQLATKYGFNSHNEYKTEDNKINGKLLYEAQKFWKENKSGEREVVVVFVVDNSVSMEGEPIQKMKESLLTGAKYIQQECSVGLVTFSSDVNVAVPINKFDINQRSLFAGAIESLQADSGTAMFNGIVVGSKLLMEESIKYDNPKLMLFVMTDGETTEGFSLHDTRKMIDGLKIPIYTIGYNANIKVLEELSSINEAASINADTEDVVYKIMSLFNAEI